MGNDHAIVNLETRTISFLAPTPLRFEKIDLREAENRNYVGFYSEYSLLFISFMIIIIFLLSFGVINMDS